VSLLLFWSRHAEEGTVYTYQGVIAAQSSIQASTEVSSTYTYAGQIAAQSGVSGTSEFSTALRTLVAGPNITLTTVSTAVLTYTPAVAPPSVSEGGGGMFAPFVPYIPRRRRPAPPVERPTPILVRRTIVARPCVTATLVSRCYLRRRQVLQPQACVTRTMVQAYPHLVRRAISTRLSLPVATSQRITYVRRIVAQACVTETSVTGTLQRFRRMVHVPTFRVPVIPPAVLTARLQTPAWYAAMDDEFLLLTLLEDAA